MKKSLLVLGMLLCLAVTGKMLFWQEKTQEASVYFVDQDINYSKEHYIDVWVHIDELRDVDFSTCPGRTM